MADSTLTSWQPFLLDMQGKVWDVYSAVAPFLAELSGFNASEGRVDRESEKMRITEAMDGNRTIFSGKHVKHSIVLMNNTAGGNVSETGTWNVPHELQGKEVLIKLVRFLVPFSVSVDVEEDSFNNSNAEAVAENVRQTEISMSKLENYEFVGDGTAKVSDIVSGTSPGLVINIGTNGPFDILLPGTVWDIATKATAVTTTGGDRRKIASVDEAAGTVTFDTNAVASDGDSGSITFSTSEGIYIPGSATTPANAGTHAAQGLEQALALTGTFEGLDKAAVPQWRGTDGRAGDTSSALLTDTILDKAVYLGQRQGQRIWDFGLGDPRVIDAYKGSKASQVRYEPQVSTLKSGFSGIVYDGADRPFPLIKEAAMKRNTLRLIDLNSFQIYGRKPGPSFLTDDGAMFRRFNRALPKEADMLDRVQLGVTKCNTIVFMNDLQRA